MKKKNEELAARAKQYNYILMMHIQKAHVRSLNPSKHYAWNKTHYPRRLIWTRHRMCSPLSIRLMPVPVVPYLGNASNNAKGYKIRSDGEFDYSKTRTRSVRRTVHAGDLLNVTETLIALVFCWLCSWQVLVLSAGSIRRMRHGNLIFKARSSVCVVKTRFELLLLCALALTNSSPSLTIHGLFGIRRSCGTSASAVRKALNPGVTLKASSTVHRVVGLNSSNPIGRLRIVGL